MDWTEFKGKYYKSFGQVNVKPGDNKIGGKWPNEKYEAKAPWEVYLDHSCDEWEIGSVEQAKTFSENLKEAIAYCEQNPLPEHNA